MSERARQRKQPPGTVPCGDCSFAPGLVSICGEPPSLCPRCGGTGWLWPALQADRSETGKTDVFELRDGRALILPKGTLHGTISALEWTATSGPGRHRLIGDMEETLKRAAAAKSAEEDPRVGVLQAAVRDATRPAMELLGAIGPFPGSDRARRILETLSNALDKARAIERGR